MRKFQSRWWQTDSWLAERWEQVRCSSRPDANEARLARLSEGSTSEEHKRRVAAEQMGTCDPTPGLERISP
jgi:hypothetical protein